MIEFSRNFLQAPFRIFATGAAGSAVLTYEGGVGDADIFRQLLYWRILLGIGAGGVRTFASRLCFRWLDFELVWYLLNLLNRGPAAGKPPVSITRYPKHRFAPWLM